MSIYSVEIHPATRPVALPPIISTSVFLITIIPPFIKISRPPIKDSLVSYTNKCYTNYNE